MANVKAIKEGDHSCKQQYIMVILEIVDLHKSVIPPNFSKKKNKKNTKVI